MVHRTAMLQRYNLWHEDRTSSAQGIEARVPFLDHRLVELLASVPPARDLLECMAIEVFAAMCESLPETGPPPGVDPPSPLKAWAG